MPSPPDRLRTAILATPHTGAACVFMILDVLSSVGRDWAVATGEARPVRGFEPLLVTEDGRGVRASNGVWIEPHTALPAVRRPDILIIPDLILPRDEALPESYEPLAAWVRAAFEAGAIVASVCSGALLLARTGLLDGREATTHWAYCDLLARLHPQVKVRGERILVPAGHEHRIITAGGSSAWNDLLLYLVARVAGPEEAVRISKLYLLQWHDVGQAPFRVMSTGRQHADRAVSESQRWIAERFACENPVAAMAAASGLPERSFHRRFRQATGLSPLAYVQALRIEEAKYQLESSGASIDEIGAAVGYAETASFRRLFRRAVGVTPSAYRRRFRPVLQPP